ncbi:General transcription factor IIIC, polypeptide 3, partial [Cladochytrium tenue]
MSDAGNQLELFQADEDDNEAYDPFDADTGYDYDDPDYVDDVHDVFGFDANEEDGNHSDELEDDGDDDLNYDGAMDELDEGELDDEGHIPQDIRQLIDNATSDFDGGHTYAINFGEDDDGESGDLDGGQGMDADISGLLVEPGSSAWTGRRQKKKKGKKGKRRALPQELTEKLGEASLAYGRSDYDGTFKLVRQIIQTNIRVADAWRLLGLLYEDQGEHLKSMQVNFVAAHLNPKDADLWLRLAEQC